MPAMPEIRDRYSKKWALEVFIQFNSKHRGNTDHNIHSSREICVKLDRIKQNSKKCHPVILCRIFKNSICKNSGPVRKDHFLKKAPENPLKTSDYIISLKPVFSIKLICQAAISADRSLQNLREKGYEQCVFQRVSLCLASFPVYIKKIA